MQPSGVQREGVSLGPWHGIGIACFRSGGQSSEQRALATFHSPPRCWKHYVDDTFMVLPCNLVQEFLSHPNSIDPCSQFTFEEIDG